MRALLRSHSRFFLLATLAALALRLLFFFCFPRVTTDSLVYGDIAKNWLTQGVYGLTESGQAVPTFIRLPGYPAFLAVVFALFGLDHYGAALLWQILADLGTCLVIADLARRTVSARSAKAAFLLAALCPFLANYTAAALTETLEIFFVALALDFAVAGLDKLESGNLRPWAGCGLSLAACILLRPDGGLLLAALGIYLGYLLLRRPHLRKPILRAGVIVSVVALAPLLPWTWRNLHTLHQFQPLAPRYANGPEDFVPRGYIRWAKTWMADYVSVEEIYWPVPGSAIDADNLPSRAFDDEDQEERTLALLATYNQGLAITPEMDAQFAVLADQRIHAAPLRYYLWLPALRVAGMWLRPRTELLPSNTRWWEFDDDPLGLTLAITFGVMNLVYIGAAGLGLIRGHPIRYAGLLLLSLLLRSLFLGTLENPESRYTLECYPVVVLLASSLLARL